MLQLKEVSVPVPDGSRDRHLLQMVSLTYPARCLAAIVGPSGCGKSTLLKTVAGLLEPDEGRLTWQGRDLEEHDFHPAELGYVPQFSIVHDRLTVREAVTSASRLRTTRAIRDTNVSEWTQRILEQVGCLEFAERRTDVLSGGQKRRLGLAMEMVTRPQVLLCDEVTSGLDPKSESEIIHLLRSLADDSHRLVLSVTHSLRHLDLYDSVTVLNGGEVVFHGPGQHLLSFFQVSATEEIFPALADQPMDFWRERLALYRPYEESELSQSALEEPLRSPSGSWNELPDCEQPSLKQNTPNVLAQWAVLTLRRFRLFFRDPAQLWLQAALILLFPAVVILFAWDGLPEIRNRSLQLDQNLIGELRDQLSYVIQSSQVGSLVSGLVMFQVILLALMGANNAAREIANERPIFEKEKLAGVAPMAVLGSKVTFLFPLVAIQSFWMAVFVKSLCGIPGPFADQAIMLFLVTAAMTSISLALSAWARTSEQASLASIYLVGFQLPLSGTVLALPEPIAPLIRPFISAYWSWAGCIQSLRETRFYDLVVQISQTPVASFPVAEFVLFLHIFLALFAVWLGCMRSQWQG